MNSIIDTMKIKIKLSNVEDLNKISIENFAYIKSVDTDIVKGEITVGMSLNRRRGHYNRLITLSENVKEFDEMLKDFGIIIDEDVELNRVDIAVDTELDFHDNFKYYLYAFELLSYEDKKSDKWYTTNLETLKNNSIKKLGRKFQIVFYDKQDESQGRHLYNTRMEFRYLDIQSQDFTKHIDKLIALVDSMSQNIELLDKNMSRRLTRLYRNEIKCGNVKSLSEFVRKFNHYIYTDEIMKNLYAESGLKGNYKMWLKDFRKINTLEFYSKSSVNEYKANCIRSLKTYRNN